MPPTDDQSIPRPPGAARLSGRRLGPYLLGRVIGSGGMGAVFEARHASTGTVHAVKVLHAVPKEAQRALARFRREAEVLAQIAPHENIVRVHAAGVQQGVPWCAMDLVDGEPLSRRLSGRALPPNAAARLVADLARALGHVHAHGIVHRDLKLENVLIDASGRPRLIDFGIAYDVFAETLTRTGECVGTPAFMAPEQVSRGSGDEAGEDGITPRTDVYGLGGILYACLAGRPPFLAESPVALVMRILAGSPDSPRRHAPTVPEPLAAVCLRALARLPADRYESAIALAEDLERWLAGEPVLASRDAASWSRIVPRWARLRGRSSRVAAAIVVAAVTAALAALLWRGGSQLFVEPADRRIDRVVRSLVRQGRLDGEASAEVARLAEAGRAGSLAPEVARRARALSAIADILEGSEVGAGALDALAVDLRTGGQVDAELHGAAVAAFAERGHWRAVDAALHRAEPVVSASDPVLAARLAAAIAAGQPGAPPPPTAEHALRALVVAPGLSDSQRGTLLVGAGLRRLADSPDDAAAREDALALFVEALADHGVTVARERVPVGFGRFAIERFLDLREAGEAVPARAVSDLVARMDLGDQELPSADLCARIQRATAVTWTTHSPSVREAEMLVEVRPLAEILGAASVHAERVVVVFPTFPAEKLLAMGFDEARRPADRRCAARLLTWAALLAYSSVDATDVRRLIDAAAETGLDSRWFHAHLGRLYSGVDERALALDHLERALALDRLLPPERRWATIPEGLAELILKCSLGDIQEAYDPLRAGALALEAAQVQRDVDVWKDAMGEAGGYPPWVHVRDRNIADLLADVSRRVAMRGKKRCCTESPTADELIEAALAALERPGAEVFNAIEAKNDKKVEVLSLMAVHHHGHRRSQLALEVATAAIERQRQIVQERPDYHQKALLLAVLTVRIKVHESLGDPEAAQRDRDEMGAIQSR